MTSRWKHIYPWIKTAVLNLESVDSLLRQTVEKIAAAFDAECLLWTGMQWSSADALQVYGTLETISKSAANLGFTASPTSTTEGDFAADRSQVQPFRPRSLPSWLLDQQSSPRILQLESGDLVIPVTSQGTLTDAEFHGVTSVTNPLQFVVQLSRSFLELPITDFATSPTLSAGINPSLPIRGWNADELESVEIICSQVGFAYSALYWRQRLEQSRQQAALVGRISRLLNSTLNPDEIVGRIVAELGYGLQCDRSILVELRHRPINILAIWDHPDRDLSTIDGHPIRRDDWQNVIEMFMQGGASYLQIGLSDPDPDPLQTWLQQIGAFSVLLVPLFIQEEFFGAVALLSYAQDRHYLIDELQTVRQVADQAAIALTNAQHYQSLWHKKETLLQQNNTLQQEALRDGLTQLPNRRSLERELEQLSTRAVWMIQPPFSIIVCDIDYFKLINDAHGHLVGDEVLQLLAECLQGQLRRGTPAYRYGGEEFVVILTETPLDKAVDVAERLRSAIRSSLIQTRIGAVNVTASFGVAQQDATYDQTAWDVLQRADRALYEAKRQGRDRVQAIEPS
ncbi:MAG: hypothetical protein Kow00121_23790 [Elainellaceae cyanobacterium]